MQTRVHKTPANPTTTTTTRPTVRHTQSLPIAAMHCRVCFGAALAQYASGTRPISRTRRSASARLRAPYRNRPPMVEIRRIRPKPEIRSQKAEFLMVARHCRQNPDFACNGPDPGGRALNDVRTPLAKIAPPASVRAPAGSGGLPGPESPRGPEFGVSRRYVAFRIRANMVAWFSISSSDGQGDEERGIVPDAGAADGCLARDEARRSRSIATASRAQAASSIASGFGSRLSCRASILSASGAISGPPGASGVLLSFHLRVAPARSRE